MEYTIPNFGQYGYVAPKADFNWKTVVWFIVIVVIIGSIVYFFSKKEKEEKNKSIDPKDNSNPYQM